MSLITGGRTSRFLQKYFGIKGEIAAPELGPEVHPVVQVTNLPIEHRVLDSIQSYWGDSGETIGDATHPAQVVLCNFTLGMQMVVKRVLVWYTPAAVPDTITITPIGNQTTAPTRLGQVRDTRARGLAASALSSGGFQQLTNIAGISGFANRPIGQPVAGVQLHIPFDCGEGFVLNPKEYIIFGTHNNTEKIQVSAWWTERAYEPSELSLT